MHFLFRLCLHFRIPHPRRVHEYLSDEEIGEWWVYYMCDPWGEQRQDYRAFLSACAAFSQDVRPEWPYIDDPFSPDELREAITHG